MLSDIVVVFNTEELSTMTVPTGTDEQDDELANTIREEDETMVTDPDAINTLLDMVNALQVDNEEENNELIGGEAKRVVNHVVELMKDHFGQSTVPVVRLQVGRLVNLGFNEKYKSKGDPSGDCYFHKPFESQLESQPFS